MKLAVPVRRMLTAWIDAAAPTSCEGAQICSQKWRSSGSTRSRLMRARYPNCMVDAGVQQCPISAFQPLLHGRLRRPMRNRRLRASPHAWCQSTMRCVLSSNLPEHGAHRTVRTGSNTYADRGCASSNISRIHLLAAHRAGRW
jgi:hypothetical protein